MATLSSLDRPSGLADRAMLFYVVLLMAIPSELIVRPLGAAGTPAGILGMGFLMWWFAGVLATGPSDRGANPVKWLLIAYSAAVTLSYVAGMSRPIVQVAEVSSSDGSMLALCGWVGVALVAIDGLTTRGRLDKVLQLVCAGAVFVAALGAVQFFLDVDLAHVFDIPGLSANRPFGDVQARSSFQRVSGTTSHPIEFGVILSAVLPIAIHYARFATRRPSSVRWWLAIAIIAGTIPLAIARSGILGAAVAFAVMFFTWPRAFRLKMLAAATMGTLTMSLIVPGLLGTLRGLFLNAGSDPSTQGRTEDYGPVLEYVRETPLTGRGIGTFLPATYRTLDNHYLGVLVELGLLGLIATLALFAGSIVVARRTRRSTTHEADRDLAQSLVAAVAVLAVNAVTFDMFGFSMCAGLAFLLIGSIGTLHHLNAPASVVRTSRLGWPTVAMSAVPALGVVTLGAAAATFSPPIYVSYVSVLFQPPVNPALPSLFNAGRASMTASVVHDMTESRPVRRALAGRGVTSYQLALGEGSLMAGSDRIGSKGPLVQVKSEARDARSADEAMATVVAELQAQLTRLQDDVGVVSSERVELQLRSYRGPFRIEGRRSRALGGTLILAAGVMTCGVHLLRRRRLTR